MGYMCIEVEIPDDYAAPGADFMDGLCLSGVN
jgi:hypothetical protein